MMKIRIRCFLEEAAREIDRRSRDNLRDQWTKHRVGGREAER